MIPRLPHHRRVVPQAVDGNLQPHRPLRGPEGQKLGGVVQVKDLEEVGSVLRQGERLGAGLVGQLRGEAVLAGAGAQAQ